MFQKTQATLIDGPAGQIECRVGQLAKGEHRQAWWFYVTRTLCMTVQ